jgi:hypothetical protein
LPQEGEEREEGYELPLLAKVPPEEGCEAGEKKKAKSKPAI